MTKVEELRDSINSRFSYGALLEPLNDLIAAAREEGAEQLKKEIREKSDHYHGDPCVEGGSYYVVVDAVLAPEVKP